MEQNNFAKELILAKNAALQVWPQIAPFYDGIIESEKKADGSPVTAADKLSNRLISKAIRDIFPDDSIVSEEERAIVNGRRTWYIDPIDGTKGFIKRNGHFAIHIGFCEKDVPTLGVVYWPVTGDMYYGVVGQGAYRENSRGLIELKIKASGNEELIASSNGDHPPKGLEKLFSALKIRSCHNSGSEGLRLMKIAENREDIRITEKATGVSTWDVCAPQAIVEAAGGFARYLDGTPILYTGQAGLGKRYVMANSEELVERAVNIYKRLELGEGKSVPAPALGPSDDEKHYHVYNEHNE